MDVEKPEVFLISDAQRRDEIQALRIEIAKLNNRIPQTDLLSPSWFRRSFAVWGHFVVAQVLITLALMVLGSILRGMF